MTERRIPILSSISKSEADVVRPTLMQIYTSNLVVRQAEILAPDFVDYHRQRLEEMTQSPDERTRMAVGYIGSFTDEEFQEYYEDFRNTLKPR